MSHQNFSLEIGLFHISSCRNACVDGGGGRNVVNHNIGVEEFRQQYEKRTNGEMAHKNLTTILPSPTRCSA